MIFSGGIFEIYATLNVLCAETLERSTSIVAFPTSKTKPSSQVKVAVTQIVSWLEFYPTTQVIMWGWAPVDQSEWLARACTDLGRSLFIPILTLLTRAFIS